REPAPDAGGPQRAVDLYGRALRGRRSRAPPRRRARCGRPRPAARALAGAGSRSSRRSRTGCAEGPGVDAARGPRRPARRGARTDALRDAERRPRVSGRALVAERGRSRIVKTRARPPEPDELEPIECASIDAIRALQLERLRWTLTHAYDNVPRYRERFDVA